MSISTPSEKKNPASVKVTGKPGAKPGGSTGSAKGKGTPPRKPIQPVKVSQDRNWGPIVLFGVVGLIFVAIVGWGVLANWGPNGASVPWATKANRIDGIQHFDNLTRNHKYGKENYAQTPPVGGDHIEIWQNCMGDIYDQQIPNEHAVHSLEHGAVWLTYRPDLPAADVAKLKSKIQGKAFTLMSPFPGLDHAVSLQAWGYQLKVDSVNDSRIDDFITILSKNASQEPQAGCSGGNTAVGDTPLTQEQVQAKFGGNQ